MEGFSLPLVIHPRVRKTIGRVAAMTCVAAFATTGTALACAPSPNVSPVFQQFGDTSSYFLAPGGSFNGPGTGGWSLNNATLTPGGDPFNIGGPGSQTLTISANGSAQSPSFCVDSTMPSFRFVTNEVAPGSDIRVDALYHVGGPGSGPGVPNGNTTVTLTDIADGAYGSTWAPVQPILFKALPAGTSASVSLKFSVPQSSGAWQIDDVFIDPYRMG